ncbi:hypothetical protein ACFUEN_08655 [Streptomyces griseorubiginosus]|uniref:hypothetical protein n=1 Tax=Streptomyces griseorubiginosus TaxID=67304 RepID=UPI003639FAF6
MLDVPGVLGVVAALGRPVPGEVPPAPVSLPHALAAGATSKAVMVMITGCRSQGDVREVGLVVGMACSSDASSQLLVRRYSKCRTGQGTWAVRHSSRERHCD